MKEVIFSVDVEEWWSVHSFRHLNLKTQSNQLDDRLETGINIILDLLDKYNAKGIFFVLGRVAEKHPQIIRNIHQKGHQIGSHGYAHKLIYDQTHDEFEKDLSHSLDVLENIISRKVLYYRAPSYSITDRSLWALEILAKNGICYDSSIVATYNSRFGIKNAGKEPYSIELSKHVAPIVEIPPNVARIGWMQIPISSGFAFRMFPKHIVNRYFQNIENTSIFPMIVLHNWEVDPGHPKVKAGFKGNLIHYHNLTKTKSKLEFLLNRFNFSGIPEDLQPIKKIPLNQLSG